LDQLLNDLALLGDVSLAFGNVPIDLRQVFAPVLRRLTDKANFEAFRFMPVTRDMTAGQRALLYVFLASGDTPTMAMEAAAPCAAVRERMAASLAVIKCSSR
jgi:hypothetical protein